ncbi:MAG: 5'-3' exonuclease H3TH domain-containing protein [Bacilli bacterium]
MKRLTIIDGNSLLFRAYYASAYPGTTLMRTKDGIPTNAIYIFANMLVRILADIVPDDGLLVAFDTGAKTFRHQQLETYKAQRKKAPDELVAQMPIARELLSALGVFTFEMNGYEGDDVAGSAAFLAHRQGHEVHLYTSDRDFLQLVNTTIKVHLIKRGMSDIRIMNRDRVIEEYGLTPEQIPDFKGLCGDASDNLPGIPGIGEKTATKLLAEYGTFEAILAQADAIGGKIGANLKEHQAIGALSKQLAIIDTAMKLPFALDDTVYHGYDFETVTAFGARYELKTFLTKLPTGWRVNQDAVALEVREVASLSAFKHRGAVGLYFDAAGGNYHKNAVYGLALSGTETTVYLSLEAARKDPALLRFYATRPSPNTFTT